jgi:hypothetical protein
MMGVSDQNMTYLDGTLPGDFGFDPLGMSDPEGAGGFVNPQWLAYSEVRLLLSMMTAVCNAMPAVCNDSCVTMTAV